MAESSLKLGRLGPDLDAGSRTGSPEGGGDARPGERYGFADLTVDAAAGVVKRGEETVTLTPLSFDLLLTLVRRAPDVVRRQELMAVVWPNEFVSDDTLSQRVRLLREALGDIAAEEPRYVASVRGWGYRIVPIVERLQNQDTPAKASLPPSEHTDDPQSSAVRPPVTDPQLLRFGAFELDLSARQLRKDGRKLKVQDQPFQLLVLLVRHAGEMLGREQIREALWPTGTFVDFDGSLNTAIKKIRHTLGDSAEHPRFIETLPRAGYRFIAPVSCAAPAVTAPARSRRSRPAYLIAASFALALAGFATFVASRRSEQEVFGTPAPFTTYPGVETQPSFSPDGTRVAFSWNGGAGENFHIYIKRIGTEKPFQLTTGAASDMHPAWSPDGRQVAFVRDAAEGKRGIFVSPSTGGSARKIIEIRQDLAQRRYYAPAWTPDGKWLAFPDRDADNPADETSSVYGLRLDTGEKRRLTHAPAGALDLTGAFAPDGRSLVFRRWAAGAELYLLRISRDLKPEEEPVRLTSDGRYASSPAWTADGREIFYVSLGIKTLGTVWRVPVRPPGTPRRVATVGDEVRTLAVWGRGDRLVYERVLTDQDIWRMDLSAAGEPARPPRRLIASSFPEGVPAYSPDGKRIAFASARSGFAELWVSASDGSDPVQLTFLKRRQIGPPRWSRNGTRIFFDSNAGGRYEIYVIEPDGRNLRRLIIDRANNALPSPSADGQRMYFTSSRSGRWEIWKMPLRGGAAMLVTTNGGWVSFESADGKYLFYAKTPGVGALWRRPMAGGPEQEVTAPIVGNSVAVSSRGIYFARPPAPGGGNVIERYSFATGQIRPVAITPRPVSWFLDVSPDERYLLYSEMPQIDSDLMLAVSSR